MAKATLRRSKGVETTFLPAAVERVSERRQEVLEAAANVFRRKGFRDSSMREIAEVAGIRGGSMYHHFTSKEALFLEIHGVALTSAAIQVEAAIAGLTDPWARLEAACARHLELQVDPASLTLPLMNDLPHTDSDLHAKLVVQRDEFELVYRRLVEELPLPESFDRKIYRITLLTLMNNVPSWYRPGLATPAEIAHQIVHIYRHPTAD